MEHSNISIVINVLVDSLNRLTENSEVKDLIDLFMDNPMEDLIDMYHYYLEREIYNAVDAVVKVFDIKFNKEIESII